ncbi:hypothetical protein MP228_004867 [Amoeboaphelidium protococcarum]|nr:hypothetical protein MP228_004867 [Amoeboaphelidium protococcarum]
MISLLVIAIYCLTDFILALDIIKLRDYSSTLGYFGVRGDKDDHHKFPKATLSAPDKDGYYSLIYTANHWQSERNIYDLQRAIASVLINPSGPYFARSDAIYLFGLGESRSENAFKLQQLFDGQIQILKVHKDLKQSHAERVLRSIQSVRQFMPVEFNYKVSVDQGCQSPDDCLKRVVHRRFQYIGDDTYHLSKIQGRDFQQADPYFYRYAMTGNDVIVHVVDTGINVHHEQFGGRASMFYVSDQYKDDCDQTLVDCNGHGTHVAGTIGGETVGLSKNVLLYGSKVLGKTGQGDNSEVLAALDAIYRHDHEGKRAIINMSLGSPVSNQHSALDKALLLLKEKKNIITVVAAGNNNKDACTQSPALSEHAITVGSIGASGTRSLFSNYGKCVDIYAPGEKILSAYRPRNDHYGKLSGTSMATPVVVGIVAQMLQANSSLTMPQVKHLLQTHSKSVMVGDYIQGGNRSVSDSAIQTLLDMQKNIEYQGQVPYAFKFREKATQFQFKMQDAVIVFSIYVAVIVVIKLIYDIARNYYQVQKYGYHEISDI